MGCLLALLLRWPLTLVPGALPLDPNSALHVLGAWDLGHGGGPFHLVSLGWPTGVETRLLAWPLMILVQPFALLLPPMQAFQFGVLLWITLGVVAVSALGRSWGWPWPRAVLTAVAATACAPHVFELGEGRYENLVVLPLALAAFGARWGTLRGMVVVALGMAAVALSSPYQVVPASLIVLALAALGGRRCLGLGLLGVVAGGLMVWPYYLGVSVESSVHMGPATANHLEPAALLELLWPRLHDTSSWSAPRAFGERLALLTTLPQPAVPGSALRFYGPAQASYLGLILVPVGLFGLWRGRAEPRLRALALAGALCLIFALGTRLHLVAGEPTALVLPWSLSLLVPGLADMQVSLRFLTGVGIVLAVGAGSLAGASKVRAVILGLFILADSLLLAPGRWPIEGVVPQVPQLTVSGPVATFPGTPTVTLHSLAVLQLAVGHPLAYFEAAHQGVEKRSPEMELQSGGTFEEVAPTMNLTGEDPVAWLHRIQAAGVESLLVPAHLPTALWPPVGAPPSCLDGLCVWDLRTNTEDLHFGERPAAGLGRESRLYGPQGPQGPQGPRRPPKHLGPPNTPPPVPPER